MIATLALHRDRPGRNTPRAVPPVFVPTIRVRPRGGTAAPSPKLPRRPGEVGPRREPPGTARPAREVASLRGLESSGPFDDLTAAIGRRAASVLVHGSSRDLVNLVTFALVEGVGAEFSWIDVRIGHQPPAGQNPVSLGYIPSERLVVVHQLHEMAPHRIEPESVRAVIRPEPRDSLSELSQFVRLPRPVQLALAKTVPGERPGVLVVANAHRLIALYDAATVPELLREVTGLGASIFVSFADEPPTRRSAFDFVLFVEGAGPAGWAEATVEFERTSGPGAPAPGTRLPLGGFEPLRRRLGSRNG